MYRDKTGSLYVKWVVERWIIIFLINFKFYLYFQSSIGVWPSRISISLQYINELLYSIKLKQLKLNFFNFHLSIYISNYSFCTDHERPQPKVSWPQDSRLRCGLHHPFPWTDAVAVCPFTLPSYHSESKYGTVNSITLNILEICLNSYSI